MPSEIETIYFNPINIYNLFKDYVNIEELKTWEVSNFSFVDDSENDYFKYLPFFSTGKSIDEIDFEIFSTYINYSFIENNDVFRRQKDYNNAQYIQDFFMKNIK